LKANGAVSALGLNNLACLTAKKKAVSFAEVAGVAAEAVAVVATLVSDEAKAATLQVEVAAAEGDLGRALKAAKSLPLQPPRTLQ
jgi:hypothetical protein